MQLLVGTYSFDLEGTDGGEGIYSVAFDTETGAFGQANLLTKCANPSALTMSPDGSVLFAVREVFAQHGPGLTSYQFGSTGGLTELSKATIPGELPCHLAFDPIHNRLASAQYWTGDVAIFASKDGVIQTPTFRTNNGSGPNVERQSGPHAHCVVFSDNGEILHWVDLGTDSIISQRLNRDNSAGETTSLSVPPGSGPRHIALNNGATKAWVICELTETLVTLEREGLGWRMVDARPAFEAPPDAEGTGAAIRLTDDERFTYVSGRRQSQISGFATGGEAIGEFDCGGHWPREFIVTSDGNWVISANERSNSLTSLRRDSATGKLSLTGHSCHVGRPVALVEMPS